MDIVDRAIVARDAWYQGGPDRIIQGGKTYRRLPKREYANTTGPCAENSTLVGTLYEQWSTGMPCKFTDDSMRWIFPYFPRLVFDKCSSQTTKSGALEIHAHFSAQSVFQKGDIYTRTGAGITDADYTEVKAAALQDAIPQYFLGNSSAEQPIPFIEESVYNDSYNVQ